MSALHLSRHQHLSWLRFRTRYSAGAKFGFQCTNVAHTLMFMTQGQTRGYWQGKPDAGFTEEVRCIPADGKQTLVTATTDHGCEWLTLLIPPAEAISAADEEGAVFPDQLMVRAVSNDECVRKCLSYLASCTPADGAAVGAEEASRRLLLRLSEISGGGLPDWRADTSEFDRRTLTQIVEHIDANLRITPSLAELGTLVNLSPSHFAKKFRRSVGLSPHRFINQRRILNALELLADQSLQLAHVALTLGFSSQAHFTHIFHKSTGMTPAKYQKRFRRVAGGCVRPR